MHITKIKTTGYSHIFLTNKQKWLRKLIARLRATNMYQNSQTSSLLEASG